MDEKSSLIDGF